MHTSLSSTVHKAIISTWMTQHLGRCVLAFSQIQDQLRLIGNEKAERQPYLCILVRWWWWWWWYAGASIACWGSKASQRPSVLILHSSEIKDQVQQTDSNVKSEKTLSTEAAKDTKKFRSVEWKLTSIVQSSSQSKLEQLLMAEQWDAALMLAEVHHLDGDQITRYNCHSEALLYVVHDFCKYNMLVKETASQMPSSFLVTIFILCSVFVKFEG